MVLHLIPASNVGTLRTFVAKVKNTKGVICNAHFVSFFLRIKISISLGAIPYNLFDLFSCSVPSVTRYFDTSTYD